MVFALIKQFDLFGKGFTPTVNFKRVPKTAFGGLFGVMYILFNLLLLYQYGKVLVTKDSPNVLTTTEENSENEIYLSLALGAKIVAQPKQYYANETGTYNTSKEFINENLNRVITTKYSYTTPENRFNIPTKDCNTSDFITNSQNASEYDKLYITGATCMDYEKMNMSLTKRFGDPRVKAVEISYYKCANFTAADNCLSQPDLDFYLKYYDFKIFFSYPGLKFIPGNYKNPLSFYQDYFYTKTITFPNIIPVTTYIEMADFYLNTDKGNILIDVYNEHRQKIDSIFYLVGGAEYEKNSVDGKFRKKLNEFVIYASKNSYIVDRNYPKIHEVVANIMGITTILSIILERLIGKIYNSMTREIITHQIFNLDEATMMSELEREKMKETGGVIREVEMNQNEINVENNESKICIKGLKNTLREASVNKTNFNEQESNRSKVDFKSQKIGKLKRSQSKHSKQPKDEESCKQLSRRSIFEMRQKEQNFDDIPKTNFSLKTEDKILLSLWDHFMLTYFKLCVCGRAKKIGKYYESIEKYVKEYTDILTFSNNVFEMEKLKYLLLDEDQATLFNYRAKISIGKKESEQSEFTKFYYFMKDLNDNVDVERISQEIRKREKQKNINLKLSKSIL